MLIQRILEDSVNNELDEEANKLQNTPIGDIKIKDNESLLQDSTGIIDTDEEINNDDNEIPEVKEIEDLKQDDEISVDEIKNDTNLLDNEKEEETDNTEDLPENKKAKTVDITDIKKTKEIKGSDLLNTFYANSFINSYNSLEQKNKVLIEINSSFITHIGRFRVSNHVFTFIVFVTNAKRSIYIYKFVTKNLFTKLINANTNNLSVGKYFNLYIRPIQFFKRLK